MQDRLGALPQVTLRDAVRRSSGAKLEWSDSFDDPETRVNASEVQVPPTLRDAARIGFGNMLDWIEFSDSELAMRMTSALQVQGDVELGRSDLLRLPIPADQAALEAWQGIIAEFAATTATDRYEAVMKLVDEAVASALGLHEDDLSSILSDIENDPVLVH